MRELFSQTDFATEPIWLLNVDERRPGLLKSLLLAIAVGLGFGSLCAAGRLLAHESSHIATFWASDAVLVAFLLQRPKDRWWIFLLSAWVGDVAFILMLGAPFEMCALLAFCHLAEVLVAILLLKPAMMRQRDMASPAMMMRFLAIAVLLAPAVSSALASACYHVAFHAAYWSIFARWFPPHSLGMAVVTPLVLGFSNPNWKRLFGRKSFLRAAAVLLLVLLASLLIFQQTHYSLRFLWLPLLMLVTFEVGILGTLTAIFEICFVGAFYTLHGHGPLWMEKGATLQSSVLLLQLAILMVVVSAVPFAAILERQRQLRMRLRHGMTRYQLLADNSRDIVVLVNLEGRRLYVSPAVYDVLGWTPEEWTNQAAADLMHHEDIGAFQRMLKEMLQGEDRRTFLYRTRHKQGHYLWMEASVRILPQESDGASRAFVANVRDISERVNAEKELALAHEHLQQQAQRDSLTQLANRRRFDESLEKEWRRGRRTGNPVALLLVDVDHFKRINDTYGHRAGDQCLQALAAVLGRAARRPSDLAARYGGEEFAVLLPDVDLIAATVMAEALCQTVREQLFDAGVGAALALTVSVGVAAQVPEEDVRADRLVDGADRALYAAKQAGRNCVMPQYDPETCGVLLHQVQ